jgi:ABC-type multidrug transport system ATPase subunit
MLVLKDLQKKFGKQHILQHITYTFNTGSKTVVLGSNGSGKSTLIKILSGALEATDASPVANIADREIPASELGQYCAIAAPYVALNPMFSLAETLAFHQDFCPFLPSFDSKLWV